MQEEQQRPTQEEREKLEAKRKHYLAWTLTIFLIVGVSAFLLWWFYFRVEDNTKDAYVHGNVTELTSQVSGMISSIHVDNTYYVKKDQLLIEIDPTDYALSLREKSAELGQTVRHVATMYDDVTQKKADLARAEAELIKAKQDYDHRAPVVGMGGVSREDFEHSVAQLRAAEADRERALASLAAAIAKVENTTIYTHPMVVSAQEKVKEAYVNLKRTKIVSPVDGIVDMRSAQLGQWINPREPLMVIVPLEQMWVNANFKETHLKRVRIGQPVKMHADIYGDEVLYHGVVQGLGAGTGAAFSVLPPQNATGNWIKIVQRLPVRIQFNPEQLKAHPLRIGLSMDVTIDTNDERGLVVPLPEPELKPLYFTDVYAGQEEGANALVNEIMAANVPDSCR